MSRQGQLKILNHPLIQHKLTLMRCTDTPSNSFRRLLREISICEKIEHPNIVKNYFHDSFFFNLFYFFGHFFREDQAGTQEQIKKSRQTNSHEKSF